MALADLPLKAFLAEELIPADTDDLSRLILDRHDPALCDRLIAHRRRVPRMAAEAGNRPTVA
ncbi:hypothetical protein [Bradyrhizobium pachyrhizi]|uniref:hypothetical protein n=1 Tax=Bradyrhizobium pachyrhizi TaxID=280333 RepID=UPI003D9B27C5